MGLEPYIEVRSLARAESETVAVAGWVETVRVHARVAFVLVRDGTGTGPVCCRQGGCDRGHLGDRNRPRPRVRRRGAGRSETGAQIPGRVRAGGYGAEGSGRFGGVSGPAEGAWCRLPHGPPPPLAPVRATQRAVLRVRAEVMQAAQDFFYEEGFTRIDTPILTGAIGESAGTLFSTDYFSETAYLAQTGQLYLEAACPAFRKVFCLGPTFRAERSKTRRHLTEFWMLEPEVAFADSNENMRLQERVVAYLVGRALERCAEELEILERDLTKLSGVSPPFPRISYSQAVDLLQTKGSKIEWGQDLGGADETLIAQEFELPVLVHDYPRQAKAFYMKENPDDPWTVLCNDMIAPDGYGEIIGGSQREDDLDRLRARIREEDLPEEAYGWYLDLRRYGTFVHSGFGLGIERTVAWITGRAHVRELIPFPRLMNRLTP